MGDIADMMLDGDLCEQCGEYIGEGDGYARLCGGCQNENRREEKQRNKKIKKAKAVQVTNGIR